MADSFRWMMDRLFGWNLPAGRPAPDGGDGPLVIEEESASLPDLPTADVRSDRMEGTEIKFRRVRLSLPVVRVTTLPFAKPAPLPPPRDHRKEEPTVERKIVRSTKPVVPPTGLPLRDRLQSLLQPPIEVLLGITDSSFRSIRSLTSTRGLVFSLRPGGRSSRTRWVWARRCSR